MLTRTDAEQAAALTMYMLSSIIGLGFIGTFVLVVVLLMLDFWTVRTPPPPPFRTHPRAPGASPARPHASTMHVNGSLSACASCEGMLRGSAATATLVY